MKSYPFRLYGCSDYGQGGVDSNAQVSIVSERHGAAQVDIAVNTMTGNVYIAQRPRIIEELGGSILLGFCYNSQAPVKWTPQYEARLVGAITPDDLMLLDVNGSQIRFIWQQESQRYHAPWTYHDPLAYIYWDARTSNYVMVYPESGTRRYFSASGKQVKTIDEHGNSLCYVRDDDGRLARIVSDNGNAYLFQYSDPHTHVFLVEAGTESMVPLATFTFNDGSVSVVHIQGETRYTVAYEYGSNASYALSQIKQDDGTLVALTIDEESQRILSCRIGAAGPLFRFDYLHSEDRVTTRFINEGWAATPQLEKDGLEFVHDNYGRWQEVSDGLDDSIFDKKYRFGWLDHPHSRLDWLSKPDGSRVAFEYTAQAQLQTRIHYARHGDVLAAQGYTYDILGACNGIIDYVVPAGAAQMRERWQPQMSRYVYEYLAGPKPARFLRFVVLPDGGVISSNYFGAHRLNIASRHHLSVGVDVASLGEDSVSLETMLRWQRAVPIAELPQTILTMSYLNLRGQLRRKQQFQELKADATGRVDKPFYQTDITQTLSGGELIVAKRLANATTIQETITRDCLDRVCSHRSAMGLLTSIRRSTENGYQVIKTLPEQALQITEHYNDRNQVILIERQEMDEGAAVGELRCERYHYDASGRLACLEREDGKKEFKLYDENGELCYTLNGSGEVQHHQTDVVSGVKTVTSYAKRLDMRSLIGEEALSTIDWYALTQLVSLQLVTSEADRSTYEITDALGQLRFSVDGENFVTEHVYNQLGNVIATHRYAQPLAQLQYDELAASHQMPVYLHHVTDRHEYAIYHQGRLRASIDAAGYVTTYVYNKAGLEVQRKVYPSPLTAEQSNIWGLSQDFTALQGHLASIEAAQVATTTQYYNASGQVVLSVDAEGYATKFTYNELGKKSSQRRYAQKVEGQIAPYSTVELPPESEEDEFITYRYNADGEVKEENYLNDRYRVLYGYDAATGQRKSTTTYDTRPLDDKLTLSGDTYRAISRGFNAFGECIASLNPQVQLEVKLIEAKSDVSEEEKQRRIANLVRQRKEKHVRDAKGRVVSEIDAEGGRADHFYDKENRLIASISPSGVFTRYEHNAFGKVCQKRTYLRRVAPETRERYAPGDADAAMLDALAATLAPAADIEPAYHQQTYWYDKRGLIISTVDAEGYEKRTHYNAFGEIACEFEQIDKSAGEQAATFLETHYQRDPRGLATHISQKRSDSETQKITRHHYQNALGKCTFSQTDDGEAQLQDYDKLGRLIKESVMFTDLRTGHRMKNTLSVQTWDAFGRKESETDARGLKSSYQYCRPWRAMHIDRGGRVETHEYNCFGEEIAHRNAQKHEVRTTHTAMGQVANRSTQLDDLSWVVVEENGYDFCQRKQCSVDAVGIRTSWEHNADGHVRKETVEDFSPFAVHTSYATLFEPNVYGASERTTDARGIVTQTTFDGRGCPKLVVRDPDGLGIITQRQHNGLKQKTFETTGDARNPNQYQVKFLQDNLGRACGKVIDPAGLALKTAVLRDRCGHLLSRTDANGHDAYRVVDERGDMILSVSATGIVTEYSYNACHQILTKHCYQTPLPDEVISQCFSDEALAEPYSRERLDTLFGALTTMASVDDQHITYRYNAWGQRQYTYEHFYDHQTEQHQAVVHLTNYDELGRKRSEQRFQQRVIFPIHPELLGRFDESQLDMCSREQLSANHETDRQTFYSYDIAGRERFIVSSSGRITEKRYNNKGQIIHTIIYHLSLSHLERTLFASEASAMKCEALAALVAQPAFANQDALHTHYFFNAAGKPLFSVDAKGMVTGYRYDEAGNRTHRILYSTPIKVSDSPTRAQMECRLASYKTAPLTDQDRMYQERYDAANLVVAETDPEGKTDSYYRNALGLIEQHVDRAGQTYDYTYDRARRQIEEHSPLATISEVQWNAEAKRLERREQRRRVIHKTEYDNTNAVTAKVADAGFGNHRMSYERDAQGRVLTERLQGAEVDAPTKTPASVSERPTDTVELCKSTVWHANGKPKVRRDEAGELHFHIYDALGREIFQIAPPGRVTATTYTAFGEQSSVRQYANCVKANWEAFAETGVTASWLLSCLREDKDHDRLKQFYYNQDGQLSRVVNAPCWYFEPSSQTIDKASPVLEKVYDGVGRVIEKRALQYAKPTPKWHRTYYWYQAGFDEPRLVAESFEAKAGDLDTFKVTLYDYNAFGERRWRYQYASPITLTETREELTYIEALGLCEQDKTRDRFRVYLQNRRGQLTHQSDRDIDSQQITHLATGEKTLEEAPLQNSFLSYRYGPRNDLLVETNEEGQPIYHFYDERGLPVAKVGIPVKSRGPDGNDCFILPLERIHRDGCGREVGRSRYAYGANMTGETNLYAMAEAIARDGDTGEKTALQWLDNRGLIKLSQDEAGNLMAFSHTATKKTAREWFARTLHEKDAQGVLRPKTAIDETRYQHQQGDITAIQRWRDGVYQPALSEERRYNAFHELIERWSPVAPAEGQYHHYHQGRLWNTNQTKGVPTLQLHDLLGHTTVQLQSQVFNFATLATLAEALPHFVQRYNHRFMAKWRFVVDSQGHELKQFKPELKENPPVAYAPMPLSFYVGKAFNSADKLELSFQAPTNTQVVPFIRLLDRPTGSQIAPTSKPYVRMALRHDRYGLALDTIADGDYRAEVFFFRTSDVLANNDVKAGALPAYATAGEITVDREHVAASSDARFIELLVKARVICRKYICEAKGEPFATFRCEFEKLPKTLTPASLVIVKQETDGTLRTVLDLGRINKSGASYYLEKKIDYRTILPLLENGFANASLRLSFKHPILASPVVFPSVKIATQQTREQAHVMVPDGKGRKISYKLKERVFQLVPQTIHSTTSSPFALGTIMVVDSSKGMTADRMLIEPIQTIVVGDYAKRSIYDFSHLLPGIYPYYSLDAKQKVSGEFHVTAEGRVFASLLETPLLDGASTLTMRLTLTRHRCVDTHRDVWAQPVQRIDEAGKVTIQQFTKRGQLRRVIHPATAVMARQDTAADKAAQQARYHRLEKTLTEEHGYSLAGHELAAVNRQGRLREYLLSSDGSRIGEIDETGVVLYQQWQSAFATLQQAITQGVKRWLFDETEDNVVYVNVPNLNSAGERLGPDLALKAVFDGPRRELIKLGFGWQYDRAHDRWSYAEITFNHDSQGHLALRVLPEGQMTAFERGLHGEPVAITNAFGQDRFVRHPLFGVLQELTDKKGGHEQFLMNFMGQLVVHRQTSAGGVAVDGLVMPPMSTPLRPMNPIYEKEGPLPQQIFSYIGDRMHTENDRCSNSLKVLGYDDKAQQYQQQVFDATTGRKKFEVVTQRDALGQIIAEVGVDFNYQRLRDELGQVVAEVLTIPITDPEGKATELSVMSGFSYDAAKRVVHHHCPVSLTSDEEGTITTAVVLAPAKGHGALLSHDEITGVVSEEHYQDLSVAFIYDALLRVNQINYATRTESPQRNSKRFIYHDAGYISCELFDGGRFYEYTLNKNFFMTYEKDLYREIESKYQAEADGLTLKQLTITNTGQKKKISSVFLHVYQHALQPLLIRVNASITHGKSESTRLYYKNQQQISQARTGEEESYNRKVGELLDSQHLAQISEWPSNVGLFKTAMLFSGADGMIGIRHSTPYGPKFNGNKGYTRLTMQLAGRDDYLVMPNGEKPEDTTVYKKGTPQNRIRRDIQLRYLTRIHMHAPLELASAVDARNTETQLLCSPSWQEAPKAEAVAAFLAQTMPTAQAKSLTPILEALLGPSMQAGQLWLKTADGAGATASTKAPNYHALVQAIYGSIYPLVKTRKKKHCKEIIVLVAISVAAASLGPQMLGLVLSSAAGPGSIVVGKLVAVTVTHLAMQGVAHGVGALSHVSFVSALEAGITAGIGAGLQLEWAGAGTKAVGSGVVGAKFVGSALEMKRMLTRALLTTISSQLVRMAAGQQSSFNVHMLVNSLGQALAQKAAGTFTEGLFSPPVEKVVNQVALAVMSDMYGAATMGGEFDLKHAFAEAIGQVAGESAAEFLTVHLTSFKKKWQESHEQRRNQHLAHAQQRPREDDYIKGLMAGKGVSAANDPLFSGPNASMNAGTTDGLWWDAEYCAPTDDFWETDLHDAHNTVPNPTHSAHSHSNSHHGQQARNDAFYGHVTADPGGVKHDAGMANRGPGFFGGQGLLRREYLPAEQRDANVWEERYASEAQMKNSSTTTSEKTAMPQQKNSSYASTSAIDGMFKKAIIHHFFEGAQAQVSHLTNTLYGVVEPVIDTLPGLGTAKGIYEYKAGHDLVRGTPVSKSEAGWKVAGSIVIGGGIALKASGKAMIVANTFAGSTLSGAQGMYGAFASGGDPIDIAWGGLIGAGVGYLEGKTGVGFNPFHNPYFSSGISNIGGQLVSLVRRPEETHFSFLSLGGSLYAKGVSGYLTKPIDVPITKAMLESHISAPIESIASELGRRYGW